MEPSFIAYSMKPSYSKYIFFLFNRILLTSFKFVKYWCLIALSFKLLHMPMMLLTFREKVNNDKKWNLKYTQISHPSAKYFPVAPHQLAYDFFLYLSVPCKKPLYNKHWIFKHSMQGEIAHEKWQLGIKTQLLMVQVMLMKFTHSPCD